MGVAIDVQDVSKRFRLYHEKYQSLKERVIHFGHIPYDEIRALDHVQAEVAEGETVGLLGHNGSGKSTLLKCIAGILQPSSGQIMVRGRVASMLELGAGFHPDLSGRDNIYLNASLMGMNRRDIEQRFDAIVAFSELEPFIDNQVKYYSSGMYTRLGFAVAVHMDPDILLIDEVLAVGDEAFQRKCLAKIREFQEDGRTIVFVSHAPELVRAVCDRVYVLDHGQVVTHGPSGEAIRIFREKILGLSDAAEKESDGGVLVDTSAWGARPRAEITDVRFRRPGAATRNYLLPGEDLEMEVDWRAEDVIEDASISLTIVDPKGMVAYSATSEALALELGSLVGQGTVVFRFSSIPFGDGTYEVHIGITEREGGNAVAWREGKDRFEVMNPGRTSGYLVLPVRAELRQSSLLARYGLGGETAAGGGSA
jgi:ABC-2 type transport system ATP-binding protein